MIAEDQTVQADRQLVRAIEDVLPTLKANVRKYVDDARVDDEATQILSQTGIFQCLVPGEGRGPVDSLLTFKDAIAAIGRADAGLAWGASLLTTNTMLAATAFPASVASKVMSTPGGARAAGSFARRASTVRKADGGYVVDNGLWGFNSGVYQSNWNILSVLVPGEDGAEVPAMALIPTSACEFVNDWNTIGMRASGSTSVRVNGCFVPDDHVLLLQDFLGSARAESDHWLARVPTLPLLSAGLVLPILGSARSALELFCERAVQRPITYTPYGKQAESQFIRHAVGKCSALIDAADTLAGSVLLRLETAARSAASVDTAEAVRLRRDIGFASSLVWQAIDLLMEASGGSGVVIGNDMNRFWADAKVTTVHGLITPATVFELHGTMLLGQSVDGWTI